MAHVVTAPCFACKYTECVTVCPCDSFREGDQMLYIDPESCIDCGACLGVCPTQAIFLDENVPEEWRSFIELNREMAAQRPMILAKKTPLANT